MGFELVIMPSVNSSPGSGGRRELIDTSLRTKDITNEGIHVRLQNITKVRESNQGGTGVRSIILISDYEVRLIRTRMGSGGAGIPTRYIWST